MVFIELGEEEHFKKALEAIDLSLQQHVHLKSLQFKLKIMLLLNMEDAEIMEVFHNIINDPVLKVESGLECIRLFVEKNRFKLCYDALDVMNSKYSNFNENIQVQLKKLECLLTEQRIPEAKAVIQTELLRGSKNGAAFDKNILKQLQLLLWETAHQFFEKSDFLESLCWYNYSLQFMEQSNDDHDNLSKLQRNRCSCFLEMKNYTEALAAIKEAKSHDSNSPQVYFLLFKIHLLMHSDDQAIEAVEKLSQLGLESDSVENVHGLICLTAQLAFECGNRKISEAVLEKMIVHVKEPKQLLVSLRCLTRLKFTNLSENSSLEEVSNILHLIEKANGIFKNMNDAELKDMHQEISWFNKIAWNLALSSSDFPNEMQQSFLICYELSQMLPKEELNFSQQKSCLLMAAGCGLQNARDLRTEQERADKLREVLEIVKQYYIVYKKLKENNASFQDPMLGFLLCYEFEVKARLGQHDLDDLFEKAMELPSGQVKVFENFASSSLSIPDAMENSVKALKLAIKCHMEQTIVDFPAVSKVIHSLISVSLQKGGSTNAASKEEAYKFYEDTLKIIEGEAQGQYPEMETIWLMTKAWNCGIHLYSAHHYEVAQKWCTLSMKFLKHLKELKSNYEPHMSSVFADVLSRIQQSKVQMQVEE
ncbi:testis-expressed protein 11-like isoform X2 [Hydractinia symbiolongicarpus]|nr:testis-expressed protein 11-like isoform X2 [Hydractinia symbiolongicarpus]